MRILPLSLLCAAALVVPSAASAHIRMTWPTPRYPEDSLKEGPCGIANGAKGNQVTTFPAGARLRVEWDETVPHDSHYRISFDQDGDDDFADPPQMMSFNSNPAVLLDNIGNPDPNDGGARSADVTLPDVECDNCTIQLIQVMYDKPPYEVGGNDIYYQCTDIKLVKGAPCPTGQVTTDKGIVCTLNGTSGGGDGDQSGGTDAGSSSGGTGDGDGSSAEDGGSSGGNTGNPPGSGSTGGSSEGSDPGYGGGSNGGNGGSTPASGNGGTTTSTCSATSAPTTPGQLALGFMLFGGVLLVRRRLLAAKHVRR